MTSRFTTLNTTIGAFAITAPYGVDATPAGIDFCSAAKSWKMPSHQMITQSDPRTTKVAKANLMLSLSADTSPKTSIASVAETAAVYGRMIARPSAARVSMTVVQVFSSIVFCTSVGGLTHRSARTWVPQAIRMATRPSMLPAVGSPGADSSS